jgi:hypothetical protein
MMMMVLGSETGMNDGMHACIARKKGQSKQRQRQTTTASEQANEATN